MTPLYDLNQPSSSFQLAEDQHLQLFLSPHHHAAAASTFFNTTDQDQTKLIGESSPHHDHKVDKYISRSDHIIPLYSSSSSSSSSSLQAAVNGNFEVHKCKRDQDEDYYDDGSEKWMPSKMRIMQKMINSDQSKSNDRPLKFTLKFQDHQANNNDINININNNTIRVCSDCNTTTTPLWRSGPRGPKSLCNACGIRQRKARRAMAVATTAMGNGTMDQTSSTKAKVKEKKSRTSHVPQCKKLCKPPPPHHNHTQNTKITFKNLALTLSNNSTLQRVFPQDVEQAAILLMELSCGFIHS